MREISCAARMDRRTVLKYLRGRGRLYPRTRVALESALQTRGLDHLLRRHARTAVPEAVPEATTCGGGHL